jgi:dipeptidyl aminopeptidase/acylaminoacyl peptidase
VITPNVRGSTGYGRTFASLDDWYLREDAVRDIGSLLDWIEEQPDMDAGRVAVIGGSYGGYMVLASLVHYSPRLACGIDIVGVSNFVTFLENTADYRRDLRRAEYGDERIPEMREFLESIAPLNNAERITSPLMVVQGANDPRVPVTESRQLVERVRDNDLGVAYIEGANEGHGFRHPWNSLWAGLAQNQLAHQCLLEG